LWFQCAGGSLLGIERSAKLRPRRERYFQPGAVSLGLDDGIAHLGWEEEGIAAAEGDRFTHSVDSDGRLAFQYHPNDRLVVGHRFFHALGESHLLQLEEWRCHQARNGCE